MTVLAMKVFFFSDITLDLEKNSLFWLTKFLEGEYQEWPPGGDLDVNKQKKKERNKDQIKQPCLIARQHQMECK